MKKTYTTPTLICESLSAEQMLCNCAIQNPSLNEEWHCGYEPDGLGFTVFAELWDSCFLNPDNVPSLGVCYHPSSTNLFGS